MRFVVIPRKGYFVGDYTSWYLKQPHIFLNGETNIMEVSSTQIRELFNSDGFHSEEIRELLGGDVHKYILINKLYKHQYE